jgi:hypothetical protein
MNTNNLDYRRCFVFITDRVRKKNVRERERGKQKKNSRKTFFLYVCGRCGYE